ncbi:ribulose-phosphate 3-epimerase [Bacillus ndiopicus]|uniref:ribulose-phosphate 3-epimerase n=1 Tax=Bacillus ndiopicus TaxID=1347368 RepID=UPI0005AB66EB|nr:ribulose-phosphate 3-epimerase [Bacillus ndiopicus]
MIVATSILSADFLNLERDIRAIQQAGSDYIHIDIMDGIFVSNVTWGPSTVSAIRKITDLRLDVHLIINQSELMLDAYIETGADIITIHPESTHFLRKNLLKIKNAGVKAGVALKLETPIESIRHCLDLVDVVLFLTCDEGFGGQAFHSLALEKIAQATKWRKEKGFNYLIEVDGGIIPETAEKCKEAGADIAVAGSYIFKNNMQQAIQQLKNI